MTQAGRNRFTEWITAFASAGPRQEQLRSPLLLAVFFGGFIQPDRLASLVQEYRAQHQRSLSVAEDMLQALGEDRSLPGAALLRRAAYQQMMIDWLAEVLTRLPRDATAQPASAPPVMRARRPRPGRP